MTPRPAAGRMHLAACGAAFAIAFLLQISLGGAVSDERDGGDAVPITLAEPQRVARAPRASASPAEAVETPAAPSAAPVEAPTSAAPPRSDVPPWFHDLAALYAEHQAEREFTKLVGARAVRPLGVSHERYRSEESQRAAGDRLWMEEAPFDLSSRLSDVNRRENPLKGSDVRAIAYAHQGHMELILGPRSGHADREDDLVLFDALSKYGYCFPPRPPADHTHVEAPPELMTRLRAAMDDAEAERQRLLRRLWAACASAAAQGTASRLGCDTTAAVVLTPSGLHVLPRGADADLDRFLAVLDADVAATRADAERLAR